MPSQPGSGRRWSPGAPPSPPAADKRASQAASPHSLRRAKPCHATPRHATRRHAVPRRAHAAPGQVSPRRATPCHLMPRHATPPHLASRRVTSCHVMSRRSKNWLSAARCGMVRCTNHVPLLSQMPIAHDLCCSNHESSYITTVTTIIRKLKVE